MKEVPGRTLNFFLVTVFEVCFSELLTVSIFKALSALVRKALILLQCLLTYIKSGLSIIPTINYVY